MPLPSVQHSYIAPRAVAPIAFDAAEAFDAYQDLGKIGINFSERQLRDMMTGLDSIGEDVGMDAALNPLLTPATIPGYAQFLQAWLPGFVQVVTQSRKIDDLIGVQTVGSWEDEEVVSGTMELAGKAMPYGDYTNIPLSSWNSGYDRRSIVRFEEGLRVGKLEELRSAKAGINSAQSKRDAAAIALDIQRNKVGFYGYNATINRTYGFLNEPNLPAYVTVAAGASAQTSWSTKTYLEIMADLRGILESLRTSSGDQIDPMNTAITLALPTNSIGFLGVTPVYGQTVLQTLSATYKNLRIVSAPELNNANGGLNVMYAYAESFADSSNDGGKVWAQIVPARFQMLGTEQKAKAYLEDYSNALGGVICKRPWAVARRTGI